MRWSDLWQRVYWQKKCRKPHEILLDENVHKKMRFRFPGHEVVTVGDMDWLGKRNGELMKLLVDNEFDLFITLDKRLEYQQNFLVYPIPVLLLIVPGSRYEFLLPLVPQIRALLSNDLPKGVTKVVAS